MRICKKCGKESIPRTSWINGKKHNFQNRKYCLECSPFGFHNTRRLEYCEANKTNKDKICKICGKINIRKKGASCWFCWYKQKKEKRLNYCYGLVGESCWICNYNKGKIGRKMLDFHHIDPSIKSFCLSAGEMVNMALAKVLAEMKKCVLLCCRCHREVEAGLYSAEEINNLYHEKWSNIHIS